MTASAARFCAKVPDVSASDWDSAVRKKINEMSEFAVKVSALPRSPAISENSVVGKGSAAPA